MSKIVKRVNEFHCCERKLRLVTRTMTAPEIKDGETVWWVPSRSRQDKPHTVDLECYNGHGACNCEDFQFNREPLIKSGETPTNECYHIKAALKAFARHKLREIMIARGTLNQRTDGP